MARADYLPSAAEMALAARAADAGADRLPPHDEAAERAALGCVLLAPEECLSTCEERGVSTEWFHAVQHQNLWRGIEALRAEGRPVDVHTLFSWVRNESVGAEHNALAYIADLPNHVASVVNLPAYLDTLRDKWTRRRMIVNAMAQAASAYDEASPLDPAIAEHQQRALALSEETTRATERSIRELLYEVVTEAEDYHRGSAQITGMVTTGIPYLDKILCGLGGANGNYAVLAARPGIGKTSLALDIARHVALNHISWEKVLGPDGQPVVEIAGEGDQARERFKMTSKRGLPVGIFSLEMRDRRLVRRMLFQQTQADLQRFRNGFATNADMVKLASGVEQLNRGKIWIDDSGRTSIEKIKAKARRWHRQYGVKLFILDYLQLVQSGRRSGRPDRVQEMTDISGELQALGKEEGMDACWLVLAQLNRDFEKEPNRLPRMSDLKDCGAIEQDADVIVFLYSPLLKDDQKDFTDAVLGKHFGHDWAAQPKRVNALVAKNRDGEDGVCEMLFVKSSTHFVDWNEWLKEKGEKKLAAGERPRKKTPEDYEDM